MNVTELTQALISFRTESPEGNEEICAEFLKDFLQDFGLDNFASDVHRFAPKRANLVIRIGSNPEGGLLLSGHIDTVPAGDLGNWSLDPFGGQIKNERLFGRGAADMKGGLASLAKSLESLKGRKLKRNLVLVATAGEENGYLGLTRLIGEGRIRSNECRWGIVGEPTEMKVVRKHRGVMRFRITLLGRSAHASKPELGVNAVEFASKFIEEVKKYREDLATEIDPDLGATVLPVTLIEGGIKGIYNVIPDQCEFFINCRRIPSHSAERISRDLESIGRALSTEHGLQVRVEMEFNSDALQISPEDPLVVMAEEIVGQKSVAVPYGTEAPMYTQFGIPAVVLGPGSVEQAHIADEFVSTKELERAVSVYEKLIERVCL